MKNLMKLMCAVALFSLATSSFAQTFGVKAGLNMANLVMKDDDDTYSDDFKMNLGFHAGATAEFPINDMFSFETGLFLATTGMKMEEEIMGETMTAKTNVLNLNVPLTIKMGYDMGGAKLFGAVGPYLGYALSGKTKAEYAGEEEETDLNIGSDEAEDDIKAFDFGLTLGLGVEVKSFVIGASYNFGIANISPYTENGSKIANRVIGISVGYKFGGGE